MKVAHFHFDEDLAALRLGRRGERELEYAFTGPQSAKHLIESLGIPHTEIGALRVNGESIGWDYQVRDGDQVVICAASQTADAAVEPRFILDGHLGRLAAHVRMLGLDCLYRSSVDDLELASTAVAEDRILITRDRRLLMRKIIINGYLVRSLMPREQLGEVVDRYRLRTWIKPFQRCIRCNHLLEPVRKADVLERLEPLTRRYFDEFRICPACRQIYWRGSHFDKMIRLIGALG
jgi:uncharacterized protein with PIN domain/sulfur carrier protein ThiS